ncbi:MAG: ABC transporter permease [Cyanobacteria bacterium P01_H01_bin.74]
MQTNSIFQKLLFLKKDKVVLTAVAVLVLLYATVFLADFIAPYSKTDYNRQLAKAPPTPVYVLDETGSLTWPYIFRYRRSFNPETFTQVFSADLTTRYPIQFFVERQPVKILGFIPFKWRLFGVDAPGWVSLLGNDINGRDIFSRLLYGGQISLTIGFLSLFVVFPVGTLYGGISGYFGGMIDTLMMRFAEIIMSIPSFFVLIGLAAVLPPGLSSSQRFVLVILILSSIGWASLSRVIRGMILKIKNQEFVEASQAIGQNSFNIITRHLLPQTASYLLVAFTLSVPGYILAESGLSFLGLGIQQPDASWGNMLKEAQDISNIVERPFMLMPGFMIFLAVLAFNVVGDAVRDAVDPKTTAGNS